MGWDVTGELRVVCLEDIPSYKNPSHWLLSSEPPVESSVN